MLAVAMHTPDSLADWFRALAAFECMVLVGMSVEIIWAYRRWRGASERVRHVRWVATSYMLFAAMLAYAHVRQIGEESVVGTITVPVTIVAGVIGAVGLFRILRVVSGKGS